MWTVRSEMDGDDAAGTCMGFWSEVVGCIGLRGPLRGRLGLGDWE